MFSSSPNYTKLKTNLRLAIARLKLLEKKKTELTEKSRREIADLIANGKCERAKIRVEYIIREDYLVEAMEIVEMYCDLLLARFGLVTNMKDLDDGIAEAVSSIIWVAPRLQSDCQELKVMSDLLAAKYGPQYAESCRNESSQTISMKLKHKLSIQSPPKQLVEGYIVEIAKSFNIPYEPEPEKPEGMLIDLSDRNNLGGGGGNGGMPQPPGFLGYPQPPPLPNFDNLPSVPNAYPPKELNFGGPSAPPPAFSYNIPPTDDNKESNTDFMDSLPTYSMIYPEIKNQDKSDNSNNIVPFDDNLENSDNKPKPPPQLKMNDNMYNLPQLPSVPSTLPNPSGRNDDIDFDDLTKRFNELKKRH